MTLDHYADICLIRALESRSYVVTRADSFAWERPCEFSRRHGFHVNWLASRMKRKPSPPPFETQRGAKARIVFLRSNAALEAWAKARGVGQRPIEESDICRQDKPGAS